MPSFLPLNSHFSISLIHITIPRFFLHSLPHNYFEEVIGISFFVRKGPKGPLLTVSAKASQPRHLNPDMMDQTCEEWITLEIDNPIKILDARTDELNDPDEKADRYGRG